LSTNNIGEPLDAFKLFYEEVTTVKPAGNRIKRNRLARGTV